ncbi:unnamed protein product [Sphagnum troendelagicum]|uniref:Uncharacterized protein n=1 Tax=Sphagnum troendelagicum TaxID=128251 RepID=A0ABP0TSR5_9BRYO
MPCLPRSVTDCLFSLWKIAPNFRVCYRICCQKEINRREQVLHLRLVTKVLDHKPEPAKCIVDLKTVAAREGGSVVDAGKQTDERENESDGRHEHHTMRCMQTSMFQCTTARLAETLCNHRELSNSDAVSNCCLSPG